MYQRSKDSILVLQGQADPIVLSSMARDNGLSLVDDLRTLHINKYRKVTERDTISRVARIYLGKSN